MTKNTRIALALTSLLLLVMYVAPLWSITLEAPQYPEGLGLKIMLTDVQGQKPHDLTNINNLNHYIGMKRIEPDAIPELRIMPWIVAFLIGFGLITAWSGNRRLLLAWCGVFLVVAVAGVVDFWLWAYDYGHNLDTETAAIKVPGMTYQPPIIGSKKLLNFTAHSWPALGGWAAFVSLAMGMVLAFTSRPGGKPDSAQTARVRATTQLAAAGLVVLTLAGCSPEPKPILLGQDADAYCRMTISDARFASQIVTETGKAYKFDSVECMLGFLKSGAVEATEVHSLWVTDADDPGTLVPAPEAAFVLSGSIRSPMGGGIIAYAGQDKARRKATSIGGRVLAWQALLASDSIASVAH